MAADHREGLETTDDSHRHGEPGERFSFVGEALPLDLVNTEQVVRGKPVDLLANADDLAAWWRAADGRYPATLDPLIDAAALLPAALALRAGLRRVCEAAAGGDPPAEADLEEINRVLRGGYLALEPDPAGIVRVVTHHAGDSAAALLHPIAGAAVALLTERDLSRLHRCGNERCVLLFYDTTKSGTRRWCSLGCMNRARSLRRYRERTQKSGA
jgi:predicted RNA-binding Zn ribbon-like protein